MNLNFAQKIFGVALFVLTLMLVVAIYAVRLTSEITDYLDVIANRYVPANESVSLINEHILEQNIVLGRILVLGAGPAGSDALARAATDFQTLNDNVVAEFEAARRLLRADSRVALGYTDELQALERALDAIEDEYFEFVADAQRFLVDAETGDDPQFDSTLLTLRDEEDLLDPAISELRGVVGEFTRQAVVRAESLERSLLIASILLTTLATILGLTSAFVVTQRLVSGVRALARGAQAVEAGDLDATVAVRSRDEIGHLATTFNHMVEGLRLKERIKETFGRYMDSRIVSKLLDSPQIVEPGGERREMTVMFIDLKNFTSISERLAPDELVRLINSFFGHMTEALTNHGAVVDKFMGDSVMAFWGPPFTGTDEHARLACAAAAEAVQRLDLFREEVGRDFGSMEDRLDIDLRIGISTGDMIVGTIGSKVSMSFTVMGDPVNLGARLEAANKAYGTRVLISERTRELAGIDVQAREVDLIRVKGKSRPIRAFELLLPVAGREWADRNALMAFKLGLEAYRRRDWDEAESAFRACLEADSKDSAASAYLERIVRFRIEPPASDWDGTWTFFTK